ncbi:MAG: PIG-L family deacetylase [Solirubrobacterales bacterium]
MPDPPRTKFPSAVAGSALLLALLALAAAGAGAPSVMDGGAAGTWQKLLKLRTTASAMHTTAHPDDEHGGVVARVSRAEGARLALLTLNRGEAGDNAIGSELFEGLGLIRTEELLVAGRYYGVDEQYFATMIDYGYSKRLDEALDKWGKENVQRDMVRAIRLSRPLVLISRFQGTPRDGHGQHMAAGLVTQEAFKLAGDPRAFPEQIKEGLRPWQPLKLYIGGVRENEDWTVGVDTGEYSPWLGESYGNLARLGLSFQRSQTGGRFVRSRGPALDYFRRVSSTVSAPDREKSFFDGVDTSLPGLFKAIGRPAPAGAEEALGALDREVTSAFAAFRVDDPAACVPALARGLVATRRALAAVATEPEAVFVLKVKEQQFADALGSALGIDFAAIAQATGVPDPSGPYAEYAPPPTLEAPTPGQTFEVRAQITNRGTRKIRPTEIALVTGPGFSVEKGRASMADLSAGATASQRFTVTVADDAPLSSRPYFGRASIQQAFYTLSDPSQIHRPVSEPPLVAMARYEVEGVAVETRRVVVRREARLPYGYEERELRVVPALAVRLTPAAAIVPRGLKGKRLDLTVELLNNRDGIEGQLGLDLPAGWTAEPPSYAFRFAHSGERSVYRFGVSVPALETRDYTVTAVARAGGKEFREGYDAIEHRDLETRYLYRRAQSGVRGVDVQVPAGLRVGYVMGVGDQVPDGLAQLGAQVTLLGEAELSTGNLAQFDAIVTGTRAYAVREDLKTWNQRLLDYVKGGGNLIVLYNTQELVPNKYAPFPAELPQEAEEVSEEDSPVEILAGAHQAFNWPNKITLRDFDGWVEQRGSKFFTTWDPAYTAMIATHDKGQEPQKGGWLSAKHGKGQYTYFAYALHRQLPYGVPGAYRLLANLLCLNKAATGHAAR